MALRKAVQVGLSQETQVGLPRPSVCRLSNFLLITLEAKTGMKPRDCEAEAHVDDSEIPSALSMPP